MQIQKLYPPCKNYIWGGTKLKNLYNKSSEEPCVAESWELSFHPAGKTRLSDGKTLEESAGPEELGKNVTRFGTFPMLVKLIDARDNLSVQVHPSDGYAMQRGLGPGKSESWYIVEADPGAEIYLGFNRNVTREEAGRAIAEGKVTTLLNRFKVSRGECYYIPAGTVHAIGAGCLVLEVQENSDITYRVYDYGRRGKDGNPRPLHIESALEAANFNAYIPVRCGGDILCADKYFTVRRLRVKGGAVLKDDKNSFRCVTVVSGSVTAAGAKYVRGDSFFCPAGCGRVELSGDCEAVVSEVRRYSLTVKISGGEVSASLKDDTGRTVKKRRFSAGGGADEKVRAAVDALLPFGGIGAEHLFKIEIVDN